MNYLNHLDEQNYLASMSKDFLQSRIDDIERTIMEARSKQEHLPQVTLENLELNKLLLKNAEK